MYKQLFGEWNIQYKFDLYFHWYNIIHELGHFIVEHQKISMSNVREEMFVNGFAVAYWKAIGAEKQIDEIKEMLENIISNVPPIVPEGIEFTEYFESIWGTELMNSVMVYGYFQMNSVLEAIKTKKDLRIVLEEVGIGIKQPDDMEAYNGEINAENAQRVLDIAIRNLIRLGIGVKDVRLEMVDNPMIQCAEKE